MTRGIRRKAVAGLLLGLVVIATFLFPYVARVLTGPTGLVSLDQAEDDLKVISAATERWRSRHGGRAPSSYSEFLACLAAQPASANVRRRVGSFQFHVPSEVRDDVMVSTYLPYSQGHIVLWLTNEGAVYRARTWQWPKSLIRPKARR